MKNIFIILFSIYFLAGCLEKEIQPNWFVIDRPNEPAQFYATGLHLLHLNKSKQVIQVGVEREFSGLNDYLLILSFNPKGQLNWRKQFDIGQDDRPWSVVTLPDEKFIIITENELVMVSNQGELIWQSKLPKIQVDELQLTQARQVMAWDQKIIVVGRGLFVYDLNGKMIHQLNLNQQLWSAIEYKNHLFVFGTGRINIFNNQFENVQNVQVSQTSYPPAVGFIQGQNLIIASMSEKVQDALELTALNSDYHIQWKIILPDPSTSSFDLPGFPLIEKIGTDKIIIAYSQHPYRRIYIVRTSDGKIISQQKNKNGIIHSIKVMHQKYVFVQGDRTTELYDDQLELLTLNKLDIVADSIGGGMVVTKDAVYIGGGLVHAGTMRTWISQFQKDLNLR